MCIHMAQCLPVLREYFGFTCTYGFPKTQYFSPSSLQTVSLPLGKHLVKYLTGVKIYSCVLLSCENMFMPLNSPLASLLLIAFLRQATSFSLCFASCCLEFRCNKLVEPSQQQSLTKRASFDPVITEI